MWQRVRCFFGVHRWRLDCGRRTYRLMRRCLHCPAVQVWQTHRDILADGVLGVSGRWVSAECRDL